MSMTIDDIARIAHEVNRAYCAALGDMSHMPWHLAPQWQRDSALNGVVFHMSGDKSPSGSHDNWLREKSAAGWRYGPVKDEVQKTHPCMVTYDKLPLEQRVKDYLFKAVVEGCLPSYLAKVDSPAFAEEVNDKVLDAAKQPGTSPFLGKAIDAPVGAAPKITPSDIEDAIKGIACYRLGGTLTVAVITLYNGFTVTGESACVSPENFDEKLGQDIAIKKAKEKIWALLGFQLATDLVRCGFADPA